MIWNKKFFLFVLIIAYIRCDDVSEETESAPVESTTGSVLESESTDKPQESSDTSPPKPSEGPDSSWTGNLDQENQEKPPNKKAGCTSLLWSEGQKFCWARCDSASTSSFWNTWCFTVKGDAPNAGKVSCYDDKDCQPDWKCKSSCGMFSPHWDKEQRKPDGYID